MGEHWGWHFRVDNKQRFCVKVDLLFCYRSFRGRMQVTTIKLGNQKNLAVYDDSSNGDTIVLGNGADDMVSINFSSYDTITLGNGADDAVNAGLSSSFDTIVLGN